MRVRTAAGISAKALAIIAMTAGRAAAQMPPVKPVAPAGELDAAHHLFPPTADEPQPASARPFPLPPVKPKEPPAETMPPPQPDGQIPAPVPAGDAACAARLKAMGVVFSPSPPVQEGGCGIQEPILVTRWAPNFDTGQPLLMGCAVAEAFQSWLTKDIGPQAQTVVGMPLKRVMIDTTYQCRSQRNAAKLSEHAFGNALDVMGFDFIGHATIKVQAYPAGSMEEKYISALRRSACGYFRTVLGPGSDADHSDHLHVDLRGRKGIRPLCQ